MSCNATANAAATGEGDCERTLALRLVVNVIQIHFTNESAKCVSNTLGDLRGRKFALFEEKLLKTPPARTGKMPLLFAECKFSRSALPSGSVLPSVRTVAVRDPTRFYVEESVVGRREAHRVQVSDTPLKNPSVVGTHDSAQGLCEGRLRSSLVSDGRVCK